MCKSREHFITNISIVKYLSLSDFKLNGLKRVNVFIGENSSGKSNIIRACNSKTNMIIKTRNLKQYKNMKMIGNGGISIIQVPPFRNLIIINSKDICLTDANRNHGIINLANGINENKKEEFYALLGDICEIPGIRLFGGDINKIKEGRYLNKDNKIDLEPIYHCGKYKKNGLKDQIDIDLLGWGTKSIIILLCNLYYIDKGIAFIEEPEISTHPKILKNLFNWAFVNRPNIQFFLTTHSSLLIDKVFMSLPKDDWCIFRVYMEKGKTKAEPINGIESSIELLERLGFQSSNLLFANYVIWVEGPSDIFYYEAYLNMASYLKERDNQGNAKKLRRGTHYEIMWYGGSLQWRLFDFNSEGEIELIFSMCRNGAVFWDYDDGKLKKRHKKIWLYPDFPKPVEC